MIENEVLIKMASLIIATSEGAISEEYYNLGKEIVATDSKELVNVLDALLRYRIDDIVLLKEAINKFGFTELGISENFIDGIVNCIFEPQSSVHSIDLEWCKKLIRVADNCTYLPIKYGIYRYVLHVLIHCNYIAEDINFAKMVMSILEEDVEQIGRLLPILGDSHIK